MKATKLDFKYFSERVRYWQNYFGLTEWDLNVYFLPLGDKAFDGDEICSTNTDLQSMQATICMCMDWQDDSVTKKDMEETALHEVLEIMLSEVEELGDARYIRKGELRSAVHKVINRLVRTLCQ